MTPMSFSADRVCDMENASVKLLK